MVNSKKYTNNNPRVHISTRLNVKNQLEELYPNQNTLHKKLVKLLEEHNAIPKS